jgi:hypothetical protein
MSDPAFFASPLARYVIFRYQRNVLCNRIA